MQTVALLYFESHITIEPVFDEQREKAAKIAHEHGFRLAELLMKKRRKDIAKRSMHDTFMTSHSTQFNDIKNRTIACIQELKANNFKIWRYKIEDTILDSKINDPYKLINHATNTNISVVT